mmetsp:Transcript_33014/g.99907  ORF Transcript_33014/g.99907 Transcript_33014/m.99907 type:complete len:207 (+) Transcript_33014:569-1189(+)
MVCSARSDIDFLSEPRVHSAGVGRAFTVECSKRNTRVSSHAAALPSFRVATPKVIVSPWARGTAVLGAILVPFTAVPFVLLLSEIDQPPTVVCLIHACTRLTYPLVVKATSTVAMPCPLFVLRPTVVLRSPENVKVILGSWRADSVPRCNNDVESSTTATSVGGVAAGPAAIIPTSRPRAGATLVGDRCQRAVCRGARSQPVGAGR